jgi:hypothetical protein
MATRGLLLCVLSGVAPAAYTLKEDFGNPAALLDKFDFFTVSSMDRLGTVSGPFNVK